MLITMSGGLNTAALKPGDKLTVDLLDGLVVDLNQSSVQQLRVNRKDVIFSDDFGRIRRGARVSMAPKLTLMALYVCGRSMRRIGCDAFKFSAVEVAREFETIKWIPTM